ncbi:RAB7A-interacting MON1-CCZ1 complex subunit 1-like [Saccostrea cucullata]|uniref:RAB7A-interacting MON1-CCZ1 complex subunit 1-like n=1 Tax=Saccostrea cuccullata TaxID=36930 RepID=UPI002ED0254B
MLTDEFTRLLETAEGIEKKIPKDKKHLLECVIQKCKSSLAKEDASIMGASQEYAKAVLDYTFIDESLLVDSSFPRDSCKPRIHSIFNDINGIENAVKKLKAEKGNKEVVDVLGPDIVECMLWRKGALMYMYCATIQEEDKDRIKEDPQCYAEQIECGIENLQKMLSIRQPHEVQKDGKERDVETLLSLGIYSDTHLLAMMYASELCYWYSQLKKDHQVNCSSVLDEKQIGVKYLQDYLKAVKGPLSVQGWSSERAEQLLDYFNKLT